MLKCVKNKKCIKNIISLIFIVLDSFKWKREAENKTSRISHTKRERIFIAFEKKTKLKKLHTQEKYH